LFGDTGHDRIWSRLCNDMINGGDGRDRIWDFADAKDLLDPSACATTIDAVLSSVVEHDDHVILDMSNGDTIRGNNIGLANQDATDFILA
jgi:hypothetical protein